MIRSIARPLSDSYVLLLYFMNGNFALTIVMHVTATSVAGYEFQQELSYRKQIARQLRIQYFDGIYKYNYA